jgi:pre-mRNA-splicing factor ISY1
MYLWSAAGLGESRIRDLNDEINKLTNEKSLWERQILLLGGPDHAKIAPKMFDAEGKEAAGGGGYRYYGAAKDLPGVREVLQNTAPEKKKRTRGDILRHITPDYYGYRDEDDGVLLPAEAQAEKELVAEAVSLFETAANASKRARLEAASAAGSVAADVASALGALDSTYHSDDDDLTEEASALSSAAFRAHVPLPSQKDIEAQLVARKKQLLLMKYSSSDIAMPSGIRDK